MDREGMQVETRESNGDESEEYDAWLELIEDHLKNIRRMMVAMWIVMILVAISVMTLEYFLINSILHPALYLGR